jgi:hypothetical protein
MENVDPFLAMFDPPYGQNLFEVVVDMWAVFCLAWGVCVSPPRPLLELSFGV